MASCRHASPCRDSVTLATSADERGVDAGRIQRQVSAQGELLANVSHELRFPLARVRVALALLPSPPDDGGKMQKRIAEL